MRTLIILSVAISLFAGISAQDTNACTNYGYADALTDSYLPVTSGSYDPCSYWLKWTYKFGRFNIIQDSKIMFEVLGASGSYREYLDRSYPWGGPPYYTFSGVVYVGPSTYNEIKISLDGDTGSFNLITAEAQYYDSDPE